MKNITRILFALALLIPSLALANIGQVTGLSSTAATIVIPGSRCTTIILQNNGSSTIRYTIDGGSTYKDPNTGKAGTDPTTTTGAELANGQQVIITIVPGNLNLQIRAIMVSGSTTLDIDTNDTGSTFPTS